MLEADNHSKLVEDHTETEREEYPGRWGWQNHKRGEEFGHTKY